jgi:hypothetical protein
MAEYAYLGRKRRLRSDEFFLEGKRRIPLAWALAFAKSEVDPKRLRVEASGADVVERVRRRVAHLTPFVGPILRSVLEGFAAWTARVDAATWVLDAEQLDAYPHMRRYLVDLLAWAGSLDRKPEDVDFDEADADAELERGDDGLWEIPDGDEDVIYFVFGGTLDAPLAWLAPQIDRPPPPPEDPRVRVARELVRAILARAHGADLTTPPPPVDLGPLGALEIVRVVDPSWEPHLRTVLRPGPGDSRWRVDAGAGAALLAEMEGAARASGWAICDERDPSVVLFTVFHDRVEPERFVLDERHRTAPARRLDTAEIAGSYAFVGTSLLIVVADGTRTAFKLQIPPDFDRQATPMVSGFWTAKSGQRFASVLRVGRRSWRFDNEGRLLG